VERVTGSECVAEHGAAPDAVGCAAVAGELSGVRRLARNVKDRADSYQQFGPHQHRASVPRWAAPAEISPQERPALPAQRFPSEASSGPLNTTSAQAYRPVMFRLTNKLSPNPRLQRTRLRSPLSHKSLGDP